MHTHMYTQPTPTFPLISYALEGLAFLKNKGLDSHFQHLTGNTVKHL